jgi:hypothetical protein
VRGDGESPKVQSSYRDRQSGGNPIKVGDRVQDGEAIETVRDRAQAVELYRRWLIEQPDITHLITDLRGHDLACWCPLDQPCHADVLLGLANR